MGNTFEVGTGLALESSERHIRCADALAGIEEFGAGVAHLVLAVEEACKAYVYAMRAIGIPIPQQILHMRDHRARHQLASLMRFMEAQAKRVGTDLLSELNNEPSPELLERLRPSDESDREENAMVEFTRRFAQSIDMRRVDLAMAFLEGTVDKWWDEAEEAKQRGLYVDFANGEWLTPRKVTEEQFEQALRRTKLANELLRDMAEGMIGLRLKERRLFARIAKRQLFGYGPPEDDLGRPLAGPK